MLTLVFLRGRIKKEIGLVDTTLSVFNILIYHNYLFNNLVNFPEFSLYAAVK